MRIKRISGPSAEPITLEEAKAHLRIDNDIDDDYIESIIPVARRALEDYIMRALATQTFERVIDAFVDEIELPYPPIQEIESVIYIDADGIEQTLSSDDYVLDSDSEPGWLTLSYGSSWPEIRNQYNAIRIRYIAGYDSESSPANYPLPHPLRHAMKFLLGDLYTHREDSAERALTRIPNGVKALADPYRLGMGI